MLPLSWMYRPEQLHNPVIQSGMQVNRLSELPSLNIVFQEEAIETQAISGTTFRAVAQVLYAKSCVDLPDLVRASTATVKVWSP